jgi:glyoxylase-like metal-dependent hydrolase (beta-lactamase superfamily II)
MTANTTFGAPTLVTEGVYCIPTDYPAVADAPLWIHLIRGSVPTLIDCGVPTTYGAVLADALPAIGVDPGEIGWVVLTHAHPDHMGGHPTLRQHATFKVAAPLEDVIWAEAIERQWHDFWDCFPGIISLESARAVQIEMCGGDLPVDRILRDGEVFEIGDRRFEVVQTRGHTRGHCALLEHESGVLFCGDAVQGRGTPASSGTSVFAPLYDDVDDTLRGLERLRSLDFAYLCPAHRPPLARDGGLALIDESIEFVHEADALVRTMIAEAAGPLTAVQVAEAVGRRVGTDPPLSIQTVYTAVAHLRHAARAGLVEPQWAPRRG